MKFIVILNSKAGTAAKGSEELAPDALRTAFSEAGAEADVRAVTPDQIEATLREAVSTRPDAVIIGGGDGTVRSAAGLLAGTGIALGVLPLGTLNHFAKDLKIPPTVKDAIAVFAAGVVREVDVGEVNGHVFINNCSLGSYAEAVRRRDALRDTHGHGKWPAMIRASFQVFRRLRRMHLRFTSADGKSRSVRTPVVVIANNRYSGHVLDKTMRARLDEGHLWLYTAHVHRHLAALRLALQSLVRRLDEADALASEAVTEITIASERGPLPVAMDGEPVELPSPLHFRIRPRALRVLVPRDERNGQT
ncbi:diacylglycerol/lipid kinase family protein [Rariglobus hedericola]|uniref:Diacylglycerol kinase family lipid kinase n=1 Tax=Rariglobus hedericola TaxID=2597822 RepID=A0A556QGP3_9BACT|nr:diacylglycerol kinase family protein [Rariglobus hedericola]TSJ75804.1 diacylglycerol kinase family lipid kinase [Rariglobus hedericola]